ncbi:shootin-1-like [Grus japonensis]|uniref:Shootin-1-like n=1 Tax=Grus japonensis TaxID=30415 RepID=A0ABC9WRT3_GRUJA
MAWAGGGAGQLSAILESDSSEEEEDEEKEEEGEEAAMGQEVDEAEERLAELEQASQALLAELSALETEFEIERTCRQQAEAYAAQVKQENKQLKRLSLAPTAPLALPEEEPPEEDPDPAQRYGQQLEDLQEKISWLLAQRKDLTIQVQELQRQNKDLQDQLEMGQEEQQRLRAALGTSQRALRSFKRVSQIVTQDYCEAMQQLELEQDLRLHAEAFAHEMLVQKKEANRQSSILLQSAGPSAQLLAALQEVGRLTRALEEARQEQQQRVKELEEQLGRRPEPEELDLARAALAEAEDEKLQLRKRLQEAERRLAGLEEEGKPEADDAKARAVQEMMERIKNGVVLRPAKERVPLDQGAMRRASRRPSGRQSSLKGRDRQLESILQRRRRAVDSSLPAPPPAPGPQQQDHEDAGAAGRTEPGDKDIGTASSGRSPGSGRDRVPFRARVASGLPRTRPLACLARDRGEPG